MSARLDQAFEVRRRSDPLPRLPARHARDRRRFTAEEILVAMRRWAQQHGEPPTTVDWEPARARRYGQEWRAERFECGEWPTTRMVRTHFETFNAALARAGLSPRRAPSRLRAHLADPLAVLEAIVEWTRRYGDIPAMADWDPVRARRLDQDWRIARYNQGDWPSARTVINHFGSFGAAVAAAGLVPRPRFGTPEVHQSRRSANRARIAQRGRDTGDVGYRDLAICIRAVSDARSSGDPVALHAALIDAAASALAWADAASADESPAAA